MPNWYRAVRVPRERPSGSRITVPTLILWGKQDFALHPSLAQMSADNCDCARLVMLGSATIHHEEPETVNRFLIEFWQP